MEMVSVIVPCYNAAVYLEAALKSITAQTYPEWEIVLVDDGSVDDTKAIGEAFRASLPEPERMQILTGPNQGTSTARNRGIQHAKGNYLLFLDGDDWLESKALETLVAAMEQSPAIDFAFMGFRRWFQKREKFKSYRFPLLLRNHVYSGKDFFMVYLRNKYMMMLACGLYRKDRIQEWGLVFDKALIYGQDIGFQIEYLLRCRRVATCKYIGMTYRIHSASVTLNRSAEAIEKRKRNLGVHNYRQQTIMELHSPYAARFYEMVFINVFMESMGLEHKDYKRSTLPMAFQLWLTHPITARHVLKSNFRAWKNSFKPH
jgi:glycosyltransferase involved in cell wall biosynthesis